MYKILTRITLFFSFILLMNCSGNTSKIELETEAGIAELNTLLESEFGLEKEIKSLSISTNGRTSSDIDQITIFFTNNGKNQMWFYSMTMGKLFKPDVTDSKVEEIKMQKLKNFNTAAIPNYYKQAIALIEKETDEFANFRLGGYDLIIDKNSNTINHSFNLFVDKVDNKTSYYGKRLEGNIFSFSFSTNEKGILTCTKGLDVF